MREVFATSAEWLHAKRPFALATLTAVRGAKPAPIGTTMAIDLEGAIAGNIGAGCHEAAIVEAAIQSARDGEPRRFELDLDDDDLLSGTSCGAALSVIVWRPDASFGDDFLAIAGGERAVWLDLGAFRYLVAPKERLVLVGATALAQELAVIARRADFATTVVDPRLAFATHVRLPDADAIVRAWPQDVLPDLLATKAAIVVLTHDPKLDLPALRCALRSHAWYVGLLGSRRAQAARRSSLRAEGFDDAALARIHGPAGLDLGGRTYAEMAISIVAEIVAVRRDRTGTPLFTLSGAIH